MRRKLPEFKKSYSKLLKAYLPFYATEVLRGPPEYGGRFMLGEHHLEWGDAIRYAKRMLALAARDHGKSHFYCFAYPLWMADRVAPGRLGYIVSATEGLAKDHLNKIRMEIVGGGENGGPNPKLQHLLPFQKDNERTLRFVNGSEIRARGFGARLRGGHPFWLVGDDMLNDEHIWSELVRKKAIDYFLSAMSPMIVPGGQLIVVGTPFHSQDLYAHLKETGVYRDLRHPAIRDGKPLWPARYGAPALALKKAELKSEIRWAREYLCQPISDEASLFPSELFQQPGVLQPYSLGLPAEHWDNLGCERYIGVDLAMSTSASADYFVIFVMAYDPKSGDRWVVDIIRRRGLGYQEQVRHIVDACKRYKPVFAFVEANQYQRVISDMVVRESDAPIRAFYTTGRYTKQVTTERRGMRGQAYTANKHALDQGIPSLRSLLEIGKLKIPWSESTREIAQVWIAEMQSFGWAEGKLQGVGVHDDTVLAAWICERAVQAANARRSPIFGVEEEGEIEETEEAPDFFGATPSNGNGHGTREEWMPDESLKPQSAYKVVDGLL